jgi:Ca2+-binding RTX toxin-like protein
MRGRALLILATVVLGVLVASGAALAKTVTGTDQVDDLVGTEKEDTIHAKAGNDYVFGEQAADVLRGGDGNDMVYGREGNDQVYGDAGSDRLFGDMGLDTIDAGDGEKDIVNCGSEVDNAYVDKIDIVNQNCEKVFEKLAEGQTPAQNLAHRSA